MSQQLKFLLTLLMVVVMAGCATKSTPTFKAQYYPECYEPIAKLEEDESNTQEIKGAAGGAIIGALGGALIGGLASGRWEGAAAGAIAGGLAGGFAGFYKARLDKIQNQNERLAEYQKMLGEQSQGWDLQRASVEKAYQCYDRQMDILKAAVTKKQMTREAFLQRMNEIKTGIEHINSYWADAENRMDGMLADGEGWLAEQDKKAADAAAKKEAMRAQAKRKQLSENTKKRNKVTNKLKEDTNTKLALLLKAPEEGSSYGLFDEEIPYPTCSRVLVASK